MRTGILLFVVFTAALALGTLLWWRFKGNGRIVAAPAIPVATRNHHSLPHFHYERAGAAPAQPVAAAQPAPGRALVSLLPEEDFRAQEAAALQAAADRAEAAPAESQQQTIGETPPKEPAPDEKPAAEAEAPRLTSFRHAASTGASLLDALAEAPTTQQPLPAPPTPATAPTPEPDEEPAAPSLYYNPITAPVPTANDQANRAAEIALRKQHRASMAADTAAQRNALGGLFSGATGKPAPVKVS